MFESVQYISGGKFVARRRWRHPDRVIDSYDIILVLNGSVFIEEDGISYSLEKNDVLLLEPGLRHFGDRESDGASFYWLHYAAKESCPMPPKRL